MKDSLTVIIPVYGEKELVMFLYNRLVAVLKDMQINYKIIYVNDADPHGCDVELEKIAAFDKNVMVINFLRNFGEELAVKAGIDHCNSHYAVIMDCDLQDKPEDIPLLYQKAKEGYNVVWGERISRADSFQKRFYSELFYFVFNLLSYIKIKKRIGSFSIVSKNVINVLKKNNKSFFNYIQAVKYLGFNEAYVQIEKGKRPIGTSSYTFIKCLKLAVKILISYPTKLIYFPFIISFILFIVYFSLIYMLFNNDFNINYTFILKLIMILFGVILFNISFLSMYIIKLIKQNTSSFQYIIKNIING